MTSARTASLALALLLALAAPGSAQEVVGGSRKKIQIVWDELTTAHYHVAYEKVIPEATVRKVAGELEDIYAQYVKLFRAAPEEKLRVKFLDSLNTYEQEGGDPSHPGHYNARTRHLVIRQMAFYQLIPTVYHEAFHQYLHTYLEHSVEVPIWFDEGMAVYHEGMQREKNKRHARLDPNAIDYRRIRMVKDAVLTRSSIPLAELLDADHEKFHDKDRENLYYSESFALVFFLMKASRSRMLSYLREIAKTRDPKAAEVKIFGKDRKYLAKIEAKWKAFVARLKIPDKK